MYSASKNVHKIITILKSGIWQKKQTKKNIRVETGISKPLDDWADQEALGPINPFSHHVFWKWLSGYYTHGRVLWSTKTVYTTVHLFSWPKRSNFYVFLFDFMYTPSSFQYAATLKRKNLLPSPFRVQFHWQKRLKHFFTEMSPLQVFLSIICRVQSCGEDALLGKLIQLWRSLMSPCHTTNECGRQILLYELETTFSKHFFSTDWLCKSH